MKYIIPKSINTENIRFKKVKLKKKKEYIDKIYYMYNSVELIGVPYKINKNDYKQYNDRIILMNDSDIKSIQLLNDYILRLYPECIPMIYGDTILHSHFLETKNNNLFLFFSSLNTYKNCKKAKIYFIYD
jgi:TRAP-type mannitol/chloroaromatic compound transport system permease small subunit